jgi:O-antigen ligase
LTYHPVVDRFPVPVPLDPLSAAVFAALFFLAVLITVRRPAYAAALLILTMPFAFYREILGTDLTLTKVAVVGVLVGLTAWPDCAKTLRDRPAPLLLWTLGAYVAVTAATAAGAEHHAAVARETLKGLEYAAIFVAAYACRRLDPDDAPIVAAVAVTGLAVSISAFAQEFTGAPSGLYVGKAIVPRIAGVLEGPNQLAGYFQVAVAALGAWAIARRDLLVDVALGACARAGLFGLAIVGAVLALVRGRTALRALVPAFAGLAAGAAVVGWWAFYAHTFNVLRASLSESAYAGGVGDRGELWSAAWRMWLRHPLLGVGAGNYELELPQYGVLGVRTHANSWLLQSLAEGGVALFAATLALIAAILATFARAVRRCASPWALAALAASCALVLHQIADYLVFYPKVGGSWWLLLALGAAAIAGA